MSSISLTELATLSHINVAALNGRTVLLMPVWDGINWNQWAPTADGNLIKMQVVDAARTNYLAKQSANEYDLHIPFVDFMWQRASWPEVTRLIDGICDDFNLLATISAKLEHFHEVHKSIDLTLMDSFVKSEIEQLIVVSRSIFDLLQEVIAHFWNDRVKLADSAAEKLRQKNKLHKERFIRVVLDGERPRTAQEITERYGLPPAVSEMYVKYTPFFMSLRKMRERIIHGGSSVDMIFVTEKGFCINPNSRYFSDFSWKPEHYYNSNLVSLRPWTANIVLRTIEACSEIMFSLASVIPFPEPVAPDYHVFIRDPSNEALLRLLDVDKGDLVWWSETEGVEPSASPPSDVQ
jgi:hypothetical protein